MISYPVRVYNESLGQRPVLVNLTLHSSGQLTLESSELERKIQWSLSQLKVEKGGSNNQLFLLSHPQHPGWTIYVREYSLLKKMQEVYPTLSVPRKNILDTGFSISVGIVLLVIGAIALLMLAKGPAIHYATKMFPKKYEIKIGQLIMDNSVGSKSLKKYAEATNDLEEFLKPLFESERSEGYDFQVFIADEGDLNAFALPGGFIIFNRGMLTEVTDPNEILGVTAHEMAHVIKRHSLQQILSSLGTFAIFQIFVGDVSGVIATLADNGAILMSKMYSRDAEREADLTGYEILRHAKQDPRGMVSFFERLRAHQIKLQKEMQDKGLPLANIDFEFLSTHPDVDERMTYLKSKIDSDRRDVENKRTAIKFDLKKLKAKLGYTGEGS